EDSVKYILNARIERVENQKTSAPEPAVKSRDEIKTGSDAKVQAVNKNKVGRNDPCPCGSGKKYKKCCGA
ncbi:MAG: SEC-C metal-binding domain-containing protein, partial [Eubacteriaceae bacterium]